MVIIVVNTYYLSYLFTPLMKIIITGAAGFIGSHLSAKLLQLNYEVVAIDDLSTGSLENLNTIQDNPNLTIIISDIRNQKAWEQVAFKDDVIIHLAATVGVKKVCVDSHETLSNNLDGTSAVLDIAFRKGCKVFYASTSEVYGQSDNTSLSETDTLSVTSTDKGRSSYVISKLTGEIHCLNFHQLKNVPVIVARFFNVIGENQRSEFGMVIPTFIDAALSGKPLVLYNDGSQRRSFCYIDDVIRAIIGLISATDTWGNIFNIGNDKAITISELASYIMHKSICTSEISYQSMPAERNGKSEIYSRLPSLDKIFRYINWKPELSWQDAVDLIIAEHQKDARSIEVL